MKTLVIAAVAVLCTNGILSARVQVGRSALFKHQNAAQESAPTLQVSLIANKRTFRRTDPIRLQVNLTNPDFNQSVYVYGVLDWGYSASLTLHVRDAAGNRVVSRFYDDALTPPVKSGDHTVFVKLRPQHLLGTYYSSTIRELNMERIGKYSIYAEYRCPISLSAVDVRPFFGKENGTMRSNVVEVHVAR